MQAIQAKTFSGYGGLRQTESSKPPPAKDRMLVRVAGVRPLNSSMLSGEHPQGRATFSLAA
jgi:NADPH2:quinone reductase